MNSYNLKILDITKDIRTNAPVVYAKIPISNYLDWLGEDFRDNFFQRNEEKHKSYNQLIKDIQEGTTLPTIVLAAKPSKADTFLFESNANNSQQIDHLLSEGKMLILDGLQRTLMIEKLTKQGHKFDENHSLHLEIWIEKDVNQLIYRFIVLNAGRKAVSLEHQLDLLFRNIKEQLEKHVTGLKLLNDKERENGERMQYGEYPASYMVTSFYCFLTRHYSVKGKLNLVAQQMSEEKAIDFTQQELARKFDFFEKCLGLYVTLDKRLMQENDEFQDWFNAEGVINAIFGAIGIFVNGTNEINNNKLEQCLTAFHSLISAPDSLVNTLGLRDYEEMSNAFSASRYNIGLTKRKLVFEMFREFFKTSELHVFQSWDRIASEI
ncbi:MAG: hypothetical protein ACKVTZ_16090 [Bacteroidia bacterium]